MIDLISRQAAIKTALTYLVEYCGAAFDEDMQRMLKDRLDSLPSAQPDQQWIPCSERLPEKDGEYFTTLIDEEGAYVDVTEWQSIIGGRWVSLLDECDYCEIGNVIAWMPLLEPYTERREE